MPVRHPDLGANHQMALEVRPAHDPVREYGFLGVVVDTTNLEGSIWTWWREGGKFHIEKTATIPPEPASKDRLPPLLQGFGAVPPLAEEKSSGGIIIPDTAKEKPQQGEVVAVGPGGRDESGKLIPIDLKAGDRVLFGKWSGTEVKIDGVEYLIMKESDVMGVLTETEPRRKAA